MKDYDYLIVDAGVFGVIVAYRLVVKGISCIIIDKRNYVSGNVYTEKINDIIVHKYGAHIFHTNIKKAWEYMNSFAHAILYME